MVRVEVGKKKTLVFAMGQLSQHQLQESVDSLAEQFPGYSICVVNDCNSVAVIDPADELT